MFAEFLNRDEFYNKYMLNLATRMAIGNLEMESSPGTVSEQYLDIYNNIDAFTYLITSNIDRISPIDIKNCAKTVCMTILEKQQFMLEKLKIFTQ